MLVKNPKKFFSLSGRVLKAYLFPLKISPGGNRFSTDLEIETLQKYSILAKEGIVEIGVLDGKTTAEMAKVAHVPIYGIDPIIPDSMNKKLIGHERLIKQNLSFYKDFYFIKDFSYNAVKSWNKKFDFIFIDGDHNYEAVKRDCEQWLPLLSAGGFMSFHDSAPVVSVPGAFEGWPGPTQLVSQLKSDSRFEFLETQDSLSVFKKK